MNIEELKQFESVYQPSKEIAFCWSVKKYVQLCLEQDHTDIVDHANDSLRIWKAAKARSAPEGFVLVEKDLIKTLHEELLDCEPDSFVVNRDICELWKQAND